MEMQEIEILVAQLADGTLDPARDGEVRALITSDARAAAFLAEEEKLTGLLRSLPGVEISGGEAGWGELAADFSAVVTGTVSEESKVSDRRLNEILAAAGSVPEVKWEALAGRISASIDAAVEAEMAEVSAEDLELDGLLKGGGLPAMDWDAVAASISEKISESVAAEEEKRASRFRIGWGEGKFGRSVMRYAAAACVLLATAVGVKVWMNNNGGKTGDGGPVSVAPTAVAVVETPKVETAAGPAVVEMSIGPSKSYAAGVDEEGYARGGSRSPVVIALPVSAGDDGGGGTFD